MVEATTGWLETYPVPHATARNTILGLEKQILWRHGTPERTESDNGTHFKNSLINTWAREHGIEWAYHIPYHAPAAGKVERCNVLLKISLKAIEIWERIAKGYRIDPIGVAKKMKFMIKQHSPDWADLQLLLDALTETEKQLVLKVAGDLAEDDCRTTQEDVKDVFPLQDPGWDPNDDEGLGPLKRYQELIVKGLERAIPKTINWSALYAIKQCPSQTPSEFLDHLRDAMRRHTTLDPGSDEGTQQLINLLLGQSTGDIRQKLQKIRGPNSRNLETLLDEAWRVLVTGKKGINKG
ncbi:hypothetical protein DUI87_02469 [Hirundo rustica rustica]|uniref:Integrase catalytic domain-containing protein n=1 Tax=Hirundo rustica rustica TaxID=333673 RepID=A0A3M0L7I8_HIRRU|nr:hypothetical protein DUI87_02469 [Hirundo rustica rustica]